MTKQESSQNNSAAKIACLLGIAAVISSIVVIGGFIGVIAILFGIVALRNPAKRGMAISGLATGLLSLPVAFAAMIILFTLPALHRAREKAQDVQTMMNMSKIMMASLDYEAGHGGQLAPHLAALVTEAGLDPRLLRDSRDSAAPLPEPIPGTPWEAIAKAVDAHTDFYYAGEGTAPLRVASPSNFIILYDNGQRPSTRYVAFADGHVESFNGAAAIRTYVDYTNDERAKMSLTPLPSDLMGPPAATPTTGEAVQK